MQETLHGFLTSRLIAKKDPKVWMCTINTASISAIAR